MKQPSALALGALLCLGALALTRPAVDPPPPAPEMKEVFPGVRVDIANKVVEFDGTVPVNAHTKADLKVFLETTVCAFDSKEHESLVVTKAKPSQVHAALLMIGLSPGKPGAWKPAEQPEKGWVGVPPEGDEVEVRFRLSQPDGTVRDEDPALWIVNIKNGRSLRETAPDAKWVFAGSRLVPKNKPLPEPGNSGGPRKDDPVRPDAADRAPDVYRADVEGTLIGLTSFGSETIGWTAMYNPDADKQAPEWIASREKTPAIGEKVTVVVRPKKPAA